MTDEQRLREERAALRAALESGYGRQGLSPEAARRAARRSPGFTAILETATLAGAGIVVGAGIALDWGRLLSSQLRGLAAAAALLLVEASGSGQRSALRAANTGPLRALGTE